MTGPERTGLRGEIADRDIIEQAQRQVIEATWIPGLILTETQRIALVGGVLERIKPLLCAVTQAVDADVHRRLDAAREQTAEAERKLAGSKAAHAADYAHLDDQIGQLQAELDAARKQTAEQIAWAIDQEQDPALIPAARIARQHAKGDGDE